MEGRAVLDRLAEITGGAAHSPYTFKEFDVHLGRLAYELRHQYQLDFNPRGVNADGKWHQLKVALKPHVKNLSVRAREGYYPAVNPHILKKQ